MSDVSVLGDLVVDVGVDLSDLSASLGQAVGQVENAGQEMAAALNGLDLGSGVSEELANLGNSVSGLGDSAGTATPQLEDLGNSTQHAGEAAHEGAAGFSEMAEKMIALAEAFAITEGLKEFASEALLAAGSAEQFVTSMTLLTGSAETAETALQSLKAFAATNPFALPDLLQATQKLTAFGIAAEQIPTIMQAGADAAAATGNSFDAVTSALSRIAITGTVAARQLVQVGVSMSDIAKAMGTSVEDATALLKKGGQDATADMDAVISAIQAKFAGASAALAQTLLGQFQILKNQIEQLFESIGEALAGPAKAVLGFVESSILPVLSAMVAAFKSLPEPVQTFTIALAALTSVAVVAALAFVPLAAGFAAIEASTLLVAGGVVAGAAAFTALYESSLPLQIALSGAGDALKQLGEDLTSIGSGSGPLFSSIVSGMYENLANFTTGVVAAVEGLVKLTDLLVKAATLNINDMLSKATGFLGQFAPSAEKAGEATEILNNKFFNLKDAIGLVQSPGIELLTLLGKLSSALNDLSSKTSAGELGAEIMAGRFKTTTDALAKSLTAANMATDAHALAMDKLAAKLQAVKDAEAAAAAAAQQHAEELNALYQAELKADAAMLHVRDDIQGAGANWEKFNSAVADTTYKMTPLGALVQGMDKDIQSAYAHWAELTPLQQQSVAQLAAMVPLYQSWDHAQQDIDALVKSTAEGLKSFKPSIDPLSPAIAAVGAQFSAMADATAAFNKAMQDLGLESKKGLNDIDVGLKEMKLLIDSGTLSTVQLDTAWGNLSNKFKDSVTAQQDIYDAMVRTGAPMAVMLDQQQKIIDLKMKEAQLTDQTGQSELALAQATTQVQLAQWALHQETMGLADAWTGMVKGVTAAWDGLEKGIADAIVSGQNFGQVMSSVFDSLKKAIVEVAVKFLMNQLATAILQSTGLFGGLSVAMGTTQATALATQVTVSTSMAASAASMSVSAAAMAASMAGASVGVGASAAGMSVAVGTSAVAVGAEEAGMATSVVASNTTAGAASVGFAATTSAAMGTAAAATAVAGSTIIAVMGAIGAAVGAIAGIIGLFQQSHENKVLGQIEESTRRTDITIEAMAPLLVLATQKLADCDMYLGEIYPSVYNSEQLLGDIGTDIHSMLAVLQHGITVSGGGSGGGSSTTDMASIWSGLANQEAQINMLQQSMNSLTQAIGAAGGSFSSSTAGLSSAVDSLSSSTSSLAANSSTLAGVASAAAQVTAAAASSIAGAASSTGLGLTSIPGSGTAAGLPTVGAGGIPLGTVPQGVSSSSGVTINTTVQAGVVAGTNGMQQLSEMVGSNIVNKLRGVAGLKV